jgi:hypothetical protein
MAATGDRIVERRSVLSVLRSWVGWMDGVAISLLLLPLYLHFVRGGNPAEAIEVLLGAIPMCFFVGIATKIKYEDWHLTASNNRLLASTAAII